MPALSDDLNFTSWKVHNNLAISLIKNPIFTQLNLLTFDPPFNKMALNYFISYVHHYEPCQKYVRTNTASSLQQGGYCQGVQRVCDTVIYTHTQYYNSTQPPVSESPDWSISLGNDELYWLCVKSVAAWLGSAACGNDSALACCIPGCCWVAGLPLKGALQEQDCSHRSQWASAL